MCYPFCALLHAVRCCILQRMQSLKQLQIVVLRPCLGIASEAGALVVITVQLSGGGAGGGGVGDQEEQTPVVL